MGRIETDRGHSNELFYQLGLTDFGNFGRIRFDPPLSLYALLEIATKHEEELLRRASATKGIHVDAEDNHGREEEEEAFDWASVTRKVERQLIDRREMLQEYFSLDLSAEGELHSVPLLIKGYTPCMAKLPRFLLRLGPNIDWDSEKRCFAGFLRELASFYVPERLPPSLSSPVDPLSSAAVPPSPAVATSPAPKTAHESIEARRAQLRRVLEDLLFPAFKAKLLATRDLLAGTVEVANLKGLYRVFERC